MLQHLLSVVMNQGLVSYSEWCGQFLNSTPAVMLILQEERGIKAEQGKKQTLLYLSPSFLSIVFHHLSICLSLFTIHLNILVHHPSYHPSHHLSPSIISPSLTSSLSIIYLTIPLIIFLHQPSHHHLNHLSPSTISPYLTSYLSIIHLTIFLFIFLHNPSHSSISPYLLSSLSIIHLTIPHTISLHCPSLSFLQHSTHHPASPFIPTVPLYRPFPLSFSTIHHTISLHHPFLFLFLKGINEYKWITLF